MLDVFLHSEGLAVMEADSSIIARLRLIALRLARRMRQQASEGGTITPSQLSVLSVVHRRGPLRLGDLADRERVSKSTITRIVARLEADGYVERWADPEDGRSSLVVVAPRGERFLETATNRADADLNRQFAKLSGEDQAAIAAAVPAFERLFAVRA